ncbi:MAG: hypothetical protein GF330_00565 [Candidatus Eisenbacteria bacterium]|nr:hypothetical protein [Candidatus Eisenbacteria bacterium]
MGIRSPTLPLIAPVALSGARPRRTVSRTLLRVGSSLLLLWSLGFHDAAPRAQEILWTQTYGGSGGDWAECLEPVPDGGYVIGGYSASFGAGGWDAYVIRTDRDGVPLWERTYGSPELTDVALCVQPTADGGFVVALDEGIGNLLRLNADGDSLWVADYRIRAAAVRQTSDGGFIVAGDSAGVCCLVKTDAQGGLLWRGLYPSGDFSRAMAVSQTADEGYVAGGSCWSAGGAWDYQIVRTDAGGHPLWVRTYGRPCQDDEGWALCETEDGGFLITGLYFCTLKVDAAGDSVWSHSYGAGEIGCAYSACVTREGGFLIGGLLDPFGEDPGDFYLVRLDPEGGCRWQRAYTGPLDSFDNGRCARQTTDGAYAMVGWSDGFGAGDMDVWMLRIDGESSEIAEPRPGDWDTERVSGERSTRCALHLLRSNPLPPGGRLHYRLVTPGEVTLEVWSVLGRQVARQTQRHPSPGCFDFLWPAAASASGVYFVRLRCGTEHHLSRVLTVR